MLKFSKIEDDVETQRERITDWSCQGIEVNQYLLIFVKKKIIFMIVKLNGNVYHSRYVQKITLPIHFHLFFN